jgi:helix-turn-helix protein
VVFATLSTRGAVGNTASITEQRAWRGVSASYAAVAKDSRSAGPVNAARILTPYRRLGSRARCNTSSVRESVAMGRRGRKRQLEVEARYWQLIESGVGTVEACRRVGIARKTGYRWRAEAGGAIPDRLSEAVRSHRYLSMTERQRIDSLHRHGVCVREIARHLSQSVDG